MTTAGYPASMPAWEQQELNKLSSAGDLSGVSPLVLAGIGENESGFENKGAGINSEGYGGFFGLGQHSTYSYGGKSYTETPTLLDTESAASFDQQAEAAAAEVASLLPKSGSLQGALASYTGGGPSNGDYLDAVTILGSNPVSTTATYPVNAASSTAVDTSIIGDGLNAFAPGLGDLAGGAVSGATSAVGGAIFNEIKPFVVKAMLLLVALVLLAIGVDKLFSSDSPTDIIVGAPGSVGNGVSQAQSVAAGPQGGTKGVQAGPSRGGNRGQSGGGRGRSHPIARDAAQAGEAAAA